MASPTIPYSAALITGAGKRVGRALALGLAGQGVAVALHSNSSGSATKSLAAEIADTGGTAVTVSANLLDSDATSALLAAAAAKLNRPVDVLINNASIFKDDSVTDFDIATFRAHMDIHALAPALLTSALAQNLPSGQRGCVINMIDQRVWRLNPTHFSYTASKAALWTMTQTMAQALAPHVRVNAIGPGPVLPNERQSQDIFDAEAAAVPLGHGPSLDELSAAVQFILKSPSITGQMLALDGGQHLAWQTPDVTFSGAK